MKTGYFPPIGKIIATILIVFLLAALRPDLAAVNQSSNKLQKFSAKDIMKYILPFSSVAEFDSSNSIFYGRQVYDDSDYFASVDSRTGKTILMRKLPAYESWIRGVSALDSDNHKFF